MASKDGSRGTRELSSWERLRVARVVGLGHEEVAGGEGKGEVLRQGATYSWGDPLTLGLVVRRMAAMAGAQRS